MACGSAPAFPAPDSTAVNLDGPESQQRCSKPEIFAARALPYTLAHAPHARIMPKLGRKNYLGGRLVGSNQALATLSLPTPAPGHCDKDLMIYAHTRKQVIGPVWPMEPHL